MIVVHPHQVPRLIMLRYHTAKHAIRLHVGLPAFGIKPELRRKAVEYRPESLVRIALIKSFSDIGGQFDCEAMFVAFPILKNRAALFVDAFLTFAGPSDPDSGVLLNQWSHGANQPA